MNIFLRILFALQLLFVSCSISNGSQVYHPRLNDIKIGNYVWLPISESYDVYNRYSTKEPEYAINVKDGSLSFNNPSKQKFTLISQYFYNGGFIDEPVRIKINFFINEFYESTKDKFNVTLRFVQKYKVIKAKNYSFKTDPNKLLLLSDELFVEKSNFPTKIVIEFDQNVRSGKIENIILSNNGDSLNFFNSLPEAYVSPSKALYLPGEKVSITVHSLLKNAINKDITYQLISHENKIIYSSKTKIENSSSTIPINLKIGWYKLISLVNDSVKNLSSEFQFGVLPDTIRKGDIKDSPFGVHVEINKKGLEKLKLLGAGWTRLHGADILKWKTIEPQKGNWFWPDSLIQLFFNNNINIVANLGLTPAWASKYKIPKNKHDDFYRGTASFLPGDINDWEEYVQKTVERYINKINYWEIWNEPDIDFLKSLDNNKIHDYNLLLETASTTIKKIDKGTNILAPAIAYFLYEDKSKNNYEDTNGLNILSRDNSFSSRFISSNHDSLFNIFSFHYYIKFNDSETQLNYNKTKDLLDSLKSVSKNYGRQWITEFNVLGNYSFYNDKNDDEIALQLCLNHFLLLSLGIEKIFTYTAYDNDFPSNTFLDFYEDNNPRRTFLSYAVMTSKLDNLKFESTKNISNNIEEFDFSNKERTLKIYYSPYINTEINISEPGVITDYLGDNRIVKTGEKILLKAHTFVYFENHQ